MLALLFALAACRPTVSTIDTAAPPEEQQPAELRDR